MAATGTWGVTGASLMVGTMLALNRKQLSIIARFVVFAAVVAFRTAILHAINNHTLIRARAIIPV